MQRTRYLLTIVCCALFLGRLLAGDAPAGDPLEQLVKLATDAKSKVADLKEAYLKLQALRMAGKAALPGPTSAKKNEREEWLRSQQKNKPLTSEEVAKLEQWFTAQPTFREKLLLAMDARTDAPAEVARVALAIRDKFPKESDSLANLVVAFAVVWDNPAVVKDILWWGVPELFEKEKPEPCPYLDSFGWYVKNEKQLCPWFKETPWRLLVYLAAEGISTLERDWVLGKYKFDPTSGKVYSTVQYDYSKLKDRWGKLAGKPYTLANILQYGGVCRDQAYFARSVCRAMGMPAYMAHGQGNATGLGHAWVGWIVKDNQGYHLESHGRYSADKFFTAEIVDPSSCQEILDYLVGIEAKGLSNEKGYDEADVYYRVWSEMGGKLEAQPRAQLLTEAVKRNAFHREAWLELGLATAAGDLPQSMAAKQWDYLLASFKEYPDFTYHMARNFSLMFKTAQEKFRFFETTAKIFSLQKRQDLVADLRLDEVDMCIAENRKDLAFQTAIAGMGECAGEGAQGAALAKKAVDLSKELKQEKAVVIPLKAALVRTPQKRMDNANEYWVTMAKSLAELYEAVGDTKNAELMRGQVEKVAGSK